MNRKLHNSLTALLSSGTVLAVLLLTSSPAASWPTAAAKPAPHHAATATVAQSIRIPFFSFSPRS